LRKIRESPNILRQYGEWGTKLKNKSLVVRFLLFITWPLRKIVGLFVYPLKKILFLVQEPIRKAVSFMMERTRKSIRMELMVVFSVCMLGALIIFGISSRYFRQTHQRADISYTSGINQISHYAALIVEDINTEEYSINDSNKINELIGRRYYYNDYKVMITDLEGKVLYKTGNVSETQVDIYSVIKNALELRQLRHYRGEREARKEIVSFYPLDFIESKNYLIVRGIPEGEIQYNTYTTENNFLALLIAVGAFILLFIVITNRKMRYIEEISGGLKEISKGNLQHRVIKRGQDELAELAENINNMAEEIGEKIEGERRAERTKNELITNVSHDLRTPLTSVMGYLGLIKEKRYSDEEQMDEYLTIAANKAEKLKILIEDLFEYTKLTNEGIKLHAQIININEFIEQLIEELIPLCEENDLTIKRQITADKLMIEVDPDKMLRVFENLIINAIKYSHKPGEITVKLNKRDDRALICIANKGQNIPPQELPKLFERFYRVDKSRTASIAGSGLGLAIAKNIVELHKGRIWAQCEGEEILFYVSLNIGK
jgi:signal transduction histidine kinase